MAELSEETFRELLDRKGLALDGKAFAAALEGARHLRREVERLERYRDERRDAEA